MNRLLQDFVRSGDAEAFRQIVQRHTDAVYSQCLRQLRDPGLAEEVTQQVFITLARRARTIPPSSVLEGWLFNTTRNCCATARRGDLRRRYHEREAMRIREYIQPAESDASIDSEIEPLLNDAVGALRQKDREAILLRFFHGQSFREVGQATGVSEDAAKVRVMRAVEKMRGWFAGRGITVTSALLMTGLNIAVKPAPSHVLAATMGARLPASMGHFWGLIHSKVAIGIVATTMTVSAAAVGVIAMADNSSPPAAAQPATPVSVIKDQADPLSTLKKLSAAIHNDDHAAIDACLADAGGDLNMHALIHAEIMQNAGWAHVQRAAMASFHSKDLPLQHFGFNIFQSMDGGFEIMFDKMLQSATPPQVSIEGNVAKVQINLPAELFVGMGQDRWSNAMIVFKNVDGVWKLDADATINLISTITVATPKADKGKVEVRLDAMLSDAMEDVATRIESGELATAQAAGDALDRAAMDAFKSCRVTQFNNMFLPVIGG